MIGIDSTIVADDSAATIATIQEKFTFFRVGILCWLIVLFGDLLRVWAMRTLFAENENSLMRLSSWFMIIHVAIFGATQLLLIMVSLIVQDQTLLAGDLAQEAITLVALLLKVYPWGMTVGIFFFSIHLILLGVILLKTKIAPTLFAYTTLIGGIAYHIETIGQITLPEYPSAITTVLFLPMILGEVAIMFWFLCKGFSKNRKAIPQTQALL